MNKIKKNETEEDELTEDRYVYICVQMRTGNRNLIFSIKHFLFDFGCVLLAHWLERDQNMFSK